MTEEPILIDPLLPVSQVIQRSASPGNKYMIFLAFLNVARVFFVNCTPTVFAHLY